LLGKTLNQFIFNSEAIGAEKQKLMLKETSKSLRTYFGIISILFLAVGIVSTIAVLRSIEQKQNNPLLWLILIQTIFRLCLGLAFVFVTLKFQKLMREKPKTIKNILHINFGVSVGFPILSLAFGARFNLITFLLSIFIYVYLLKSVDRISGEMLTGGQTKI
jgi:hypothetical protein